ncbi:MAG: tandem-95 repeat protein, partial [Halobacteria archaeon]|nr:tandem-95 repeat protein [Halobacteria archaeon]
DYENPGDADLNNDYVVQVQVDDQQGGTATQTITVTVTDANDAPVITSVNTVSVAENQTSVMTVTYTDADVPADTILYSLIGGADGGLFSIDGSGNLSFNAPTDYENPGDADLNNDYVVQVQVDDQQGGTATQTITVTVTDVNDAPTVANAIPDQVATEDVLFNFTFAANTFNDADVGDTLSYTSDASGWLSFDAATRTFTGTPLNADVGTTTVTVTADDGNGGTVSDTFDIVIINVNDAPVANNDAFIVNEGSTTTLDLAGNDIDVDDGLDLTSINIVSGPTNGAITVNADGTVDYTHNGSETLADSFSYTILDNSSAVSNTGTVNITVTPVNDAPVATNDNLVTYQGVLSIITVADLLGNDTDAEGNPLTITGFTQPANGTVVNNGDGTWTYIPDPTFLGVDSFTYTIDDGNGGTDTGTLNLIVNTLAGRTPTQIQEIQQNNNIIIFEPQSTVQQQEAKRFHNRQESYEYTTARDVSALLSILNPVEVTEATISLDDESTDIDRRDREISSISNEMLWQELDQLRNEINDSAENDDILGMRFSDIIMSIGSLSVMSGLIAWLLQGGSLAASFISAMPLWKGVDILPVLGKSKSEREDEQRDPDNTSADKRVERLIKGETSHW